MIACNQDLTFKIEKYYVTALARSYFSGVYIAPHLALDQVEETPIYIFTFVLNALPL